MCCCSRTQQSCISSIAVNMVAVLSPEARVFLTSRLLHQSRPLILRKACAVICTLRQRRGQQVSSEQKKRSRCCSRKTAMLPHAQHLFPSNGQPGSNATRHSVTCL